MTYIFLDEIQKVEGFEKVVDSLYIKENVDVYMTGSNSWLLSGELATLLSGRYIEVKMLPFSFAEFYKSQGGGDADRLFADYMANGSFPYIATIGQDKRKNRYVSGGYLQYRYRQGYRGTAKQKGKKIRTREKCRIFLC